MYEDHFGTDWDSLTQEAAMFRAFALGVDAALGEPDEAEFEVLQREHHRGLIQIAYDEGKTRAEANLRKRGGSRSISRGTEFEQGDREWAVWEELVLEQETDEDAFEAVAVSRSQLDLPDALYHPSLLDRPSDTDDRIRLPRFLLR
ncbi:MAG: hypothetical protein U5K70_04900 [Halodesulfurarchaeum sp.]|nr:hypothetical protein [Halodesulfurarchaeum sp.]